MTRADIKAGFSCNNRCRFCVQGDKRSRLADRSTEEVRALLDQARETADEVVFTGGEVTIRKDLPELVAHAHALGFRVIQIQTNGRMLSRMPFVDALIDAGATEFSPALHGPTAELHDHLTRAPGSFRQTVKGIRNVKKRGRPVIVNSVLVQENAAVLADTARLLVALRVDQFQVAFVHPLGTAGQDFDTVVPRMRDVAGPVRDALNIGLAAGIRVMTEAIPLCILGSHAAYAAEWHMPRLRIYDAGRIIEDYTAARLESGKLRGPPCAACARKHECEGPWREYPEHYGWSEFTPIPADPLPAEA